MVYAVAEWAKGALAGMAKGAPFSLGVTKHHFATVAAAANSPGNDLSKVCGSELWYFVGLSDGINFR